VATGKESYSVVILRKPKEECKIENKGYMRLKEAILQLRTGEDKTKKHQVIIARLLC